MELGLKGKSVLVLASSKGLGKAAAFQFAKEGAKVMITSRNEEQLKVAQEEIINETNANIRYFVCDVKKPSQIKELVNETVTQFGTIDVLVNNTGGPPAGFFDDFDDEKWMDAFELTLLSFIRSIREVLPHMKKQGHGRIVNIASTSIKQPIDGLILSNTFRTGITGLSKSLSQELAKDKILINTVGPGRFATDRVVEIDHKRAKNLNVSYEELINSAQASIPLGRYGVPEEFAKTIVFLASEANTYITGQSLVVDGGLTKAF
ncbi:SDR family oxidoreductase [Fredinandcohnia sp. 179-A 10B2 NHS]|uniref:SDR family oxidoreductase n=1 Tax=Fredinandcohnia sp. 179-A 10B2 NHS TaxID=3235176 RepID=UPI00399EEA6C